MGLDNGLNSCGESDIVGAKLFLQTSGEVCDDGDGLADLLRHSFHEEFLAIGRDTEERGGENGPAANQYLRGAEFERVARRFNWHCHQRLIANEVEEFFAVGAP